MAAPVVWVNPVTQNYQIDTLGGDDADTPNSIAAVGWGGTLVGSYSASQDVTIWFTPTARGFLRQRQSPRSSRARVNQDPVIRQRQRFI